MKLVSLIGAFLLAAGTLAGQTLSSFLLEKPLTTKQFDDSTFQNHSSVRNLWYFLPDSVEAPAWASAPSPAREWLRSKILHDHTVIIKEPGFFILADPLFDAGVGRETVTGTPTWVNTRGVQAYGRIGKPAFEFYTSYYESQSKLPPYLDSIAHRIGGVPGQGYHFLANGSVDHGYATGWLRYRANRYFTFEGGTGRNFFGNGYRSMLLSDNARNSPYFRIDTRIWHIRYVNLWTEYQDNRFKDTPRGAFSKKYGAFHYLSWSVTRRLELSFFEAVIWQGRDSTHTRGFDVNYLNPVILYRPVEWTLGSPDNALMGAAFSWQPLINTTLYGQFIIDEWSVSHMKNRDGWYSNKYGGQIGIRTVIPLGEMSSPRKPGPASLPPQSPLASRFTLHVLSELNFARPYTFSHWNLKESYSHFSQPLADPLGANFIEWVNIAGIRADRLIIEGRYQRALFGADSAGLNYGHDILQPYTTYVNELGNYIGQGLRTTLTYTTLSVNWIVNPASLLTVFISATDRHQRTVNGDRHELWLNVGLRNALRNIYYDF